MIWRYRGECWLPTGEDFNGDGLDDLTALFVAVKNADGSSTTTRTDRNRDNSLRGETVSTTGASASRRRSRLTPTAKVRLK
jgi:hypothetical protein